MWMLVDAIFIELLVVIAIVFNIFSFLSCQTHIIYCHLRTQQDANAKELKITCTHGRIINLIEMHSRIIDSIAIKIGIQNII